MGSLLKKLISSPPRIPHLPGPCQKSIRGGIPVSHPLSMSSFPSWALTGPVQCVGRSARGSCRGPSLSNRSVPPPVQTTEPRAIFIIGPLGFTASCFSASQPIPTNASRSVGKSSIEDTRTEITEFLFSVHYKHCLSCDSSSFFHLTSVNEPISPERHCTVVYPRIFIFSPQGKPLSGASQALCTLSLSGRVNSFPDLLSVLRTSV